MNSISKKVLSGLFALISLPFLIIAQVENGLSGKVQISKYDLPTQAQNLLLNGVWEVGTQGNYFGERVVPGIVNDPAKIDESSVWLKREIHLPAGSWTKATLNLKGTRFNPKVYINGELVSSQKGGMAPTRHLLDHKYDH